MARVLGSLGTERAWIVHGQGLDEITTTGATEVAEWRDGEVHRFEITPEAVGLPRANLADLIGGAPVDNARALREVLAGESGAYRDIVLLNTAAAFVVGDRVATLADGVALAAEVIDQGLAASALEQLAAITGRQ